MSENSSSFAPYDADRPLMLKCSCGQDHSAADHHAAVAADGAAIELRRRSLTSEFEAYSNEFIEATLVKAIFPQDAVRRRFLRAVGKSSAMAAIASVLPVASIQALAQEAGKKTGALEKTNMKIGFIPITCATPLIMAAPLGFYQQQGLSVEVTKTAGWALIRDKMINKEYDATHFLSPMPLAISMGLGSNATPMNVATIQNINGQAITLALKHKTNRDPKNRELIAKVIAPAQYLNQPEAVLNQVLTGKFADGLGNVNYKQIAEKVFLITDAKKHMKELGQKTSDGAYPKFTIMGKEFDAAKAEQYAAGFAINKIG